MDTEVLDRRLEELFAVAKAQAREAVEKAPDGSWIPASEWQVREVFVRLARDSFQALVQARADDHASASQASFSPWAGRGAAEQGKAGDPRADGQRRD